MVSPQRTLRYPYNKVQGPPIIVGDYDGEHHAGMGNGTHNLLIGGHEPLPPSQGPWCLHRLAIEIGRWTTIPISKDTRLSLYHFCSSNAVEQEAHFVLECLLYIPIRHKFPSLFEEVILGCLKYFYYFTFSNWTMKLTVASISQRLPHSNTLEN
jgi:hypothetical protein